ncbi:hypothetical protein B2J93_6520 [Marssonina coronariae]|uniref:Uncharacterized protein n=1 Tax=Diplocarpon coronariae TaxID=2795749 RepID=A0A218Z1C9_9HELO|nr:hypothetical protein B2J93_6520 [Marssonina coronariae]
MGVSRRMPRLQWYATDQSIARLLPNLAVVRCTSQGAEKGSATRSRGSPQDTTPAKDPLHPLEGDRSTRIRKIANYKLSQQGRSPLPAASGSAAGGERERGELVAAAISAPGVATSRLSQTIRASSVDVQARTPRAEFRGSRLLTQCSARRLARPAWERGVCIRYESARHKPNSNRRRPKSNALCRLRSDQDPTQDALLAVGSPGVTSQPCHPILITSMAISAFGGRVCLASTPSATVAGLSRVSFGAHLSPDGDEGQGSRSVRLTVRARDRPESRVSCRPTVPVGRALRGDRGPERDLSRRGGVARPRTLDREA